MEESEAFRSPLRGDSTESLIRKLGLEPHPEGGYFKECYRSADASGDLPPRFGKDRESLPFCTSIYFLVADPDFSAFHRIKSDELWYFHAGTGIVVHELKPDRSYSALRLSPGGSFFCTVSAGSWFAAEPASAQATNVGSAWALVSCVVSPGFDYRDFELAPSAALAEEYPEYRALIERLTRR
jgi:hypothetical protein